MQIPDQPRDLHNDIGQTGEQETLISPIIQLQAKLPTTKRFAQQLDILNKLIHIQVAKLAPEEVAQECLKAAQHLLPGIAGRLWEWVQESERMHLLTSIGLYHPEKGALCHNLGRV